MLGDKERKSLAEFYEERRRQEKERRAHKCCRNCGFYVKGDCGYWDYPEKDVDHQYCRKWR